MQRSGLLFLASSAPLASARGAFAPCHAAQQQPSRSAVLSVKRPRGGGPQTPFDTWMGLDKALVEAEALDESAVLH